MIIIYIVSRKIIFNQDLDLNTAQETALVKVTNDFLMLSDSGSVSVVVLLDLSAAFGTTDSKIDRLEQVVGIRGMALKLF